MRNALASIAVVSLLVMAFLYLAMSTPAPYSDEHRTFTKADELRLYVHYPGGYFPSARVYVWCSPLPNNDRFGEHVWMYADGRTAWPRTTCWLRERQ